MNKMIKGAVVAGLGVALLLGGGGTLAYWNQAVESEAGVVAAGDLNLVSQGETWTSDATGTIADIAEYRVVPGETLTFSQELEVTLVGDQMQAELTVDGAVNQGFVDGTVDITGPEITDAAGNAIAPVLKPAADSDTVTVTASVTFVFSAETTDRQSTNASYDFSQVRFVLSQLSPSQA
ncbi:alternate-type signal peptide domain-containing protein [Tessaracoccus rhinocerotis]|nr:alternate-type signal peptide domain-containing protein [Tessaracoccus rhinocerotis]